MGSLYGTHEIVELKDEPNLNKTEKKPQGGIKSVDDDINKLFEAINIRKSFNGFSLSDDTNGSTPRRNPSKKPMRMSTSSSSGYSEPLSLKQALRGLSISQASEMAAIKRLSMPPGSPALSDSGKLADLYKSVVKASESRSSIAKDKETESTCSSSRTIPQYPREKTMKPYSKSAQSSPQPSLEKSTKKSTKESTKSQLESGCQPSINEPVQEKKIISVKNVNNSTKKNTLTPSKPASKSRYKGKSTRPVKTTIRTKTLMKKKSKQGLISDPVTSNAKSSPETSQLVCQRCHCALKDPNQVSITKNTSFLNNNKNPKHKDKWDFTQSSNSSVCEYSISTSISEERNLGTFSIGNRPHMSKDTNWQAINQMVKQNGFLGLRHFNLLKKLGCGDIGTVYLAELIGTNCPFAIKVMDNDFLEMRQKMPRAHMEKDILSILDHPFLPTLYAHFVSENLSCLVMEYCPGGDLHVLRQKQPGRFFHEQAARFYVAEVLLALEYLHMLGIIYRDLKPENILVRQDGHIMVTDFDLSLRCTVNPFLLEPSSSGPLEPPRVSGPCAGSNCIDPFCMKPTCQVTCFRPRVPPTSKPHKKTNPGPLPQLVAEPTEARSNSFVGTHEYLAPEIIKGEGHGSSVDWWTFGVFLYELLYGKTPFKGPRNDDTLANVVLESLRFPETPLVSFHARDLIKGLLVKEPENRLGSKRGAAEIKKHPFFDGLNWALIRCVAPPELPEAFDVTGSNPDPLEKAKKYLDYNGPGGGHLEFELF